jgi:hypothetical protein
MGWAIRGHTAQFVKGDDSTEGPEIESLMPRRRWTFTSSHRPHEGL